MRDGLAPAYYHILDKLVSRRKIDDNGCWLYTGFIRPDGYAHISVFGSTQLVHRIAYKILVAEPKDFVLHRPICKSRACFNPEHLYDGTQWENVKDSTEAKTHYFPEGRHKRGLNAKRK